MEIQTDTYLRPREVVELRQGQILPPAQTAERGAHFGIVYAPSVDETAKNGQQDNSLLVGDVARPWLTSVLQLLHSPTAASKTKIFDFTLADYMREVKKSSARRGYTSLGICPHVFRHAGASNDKARSRRTLKEIVKRGRWATSASVARYEKGSLFLEQVREIPLPKQKKATERSKQLPQTLLRMLRQM